MTVKGVDVSAWNGAAMDWAAVKKAGASFAFTKLSEGTGYLAGTFLAHWGGIASADLLRGAIHFARPDLGTKAEDEARFFLGHLPDLAPSDLVILDLEVPTSGPGALDTWALAWLQTVEKDVGFRPLLYTGEWFARGLGRLSAPELAHYPLWTSAYHQPPAPPPYQPWPGAALWQWTDAATWYPTMGAVDESILLRGTVDDLKVLGKPAPKTPQPQPKPAYPEAGKHLRLTVATHLRPRPALDAMPLGRLLPVGTQVVELEPPRGLPIETTSWAWIRTSGDVQGYVYKPDTVPYAP